MALMITRRQRDVLRLIRDRRITTRQEIADLTGLSTSQVSRLTAQLLGKHLIAVEQQLSSSEGRPTDLLALAPDQRYVIGMDIGGLTQNAVICNLRGEIIDSIVGNVSLSENQAVVVEYVRSTSFMFLERTRVPAHQVLGIGIGLRAVVDPTSGVITAGPETPEWAQSWRDFAIRDALARILPWSCIVVDDTVRALAAVERRVSHASSDQDIVYLLADSGIGAALVIDGRPYLGSTHIAGEVGHVIVDPGGGKCGCGRTGCLETVASTGAMVARARMATGDDSLTIEDVVVRADRRDPDICPIVMAGGCALGKVVAVILNLLAPAAIVLGGRAVQSDVYFEEIVRVSRENALEQIASSANIMRSTLGPLAGARGAGIMVLDIIFDSHPQANVRSGRRHGTSRKIRKRVAMHQEKQQ